MRRAVGWTPVAFGLVLFVSSATVEAKPAPKAKVVAGKAAKTGAAKKSKLETVTFGAQQVEGRLRSPHILYFLRRVRAQFAPRPLGHRSFLLELADTRRSRALR